MCSTACQILGKPSNLKCVEGSLWPSASWPASAPCKHTFGCKGTEIHLLHRRRSLCISQLKLWLTSDSSWCAKRCGRLLAMLSWMSWSWLVFTKCKYLTQADSNKLSSPILSGNSSRESQISETWRHRESPYCSSFPPLTEERSAHIVTFRSLQNPKPAYLPLHRTVSSPSFTMTAVNVLENISPATGRNEGSYLGCSFKLNTCQLQIME